MLTKDELHYLERDLENLFHECPENYIVPMGAILDLVAQAMYDLDPNGIEGNSRDPGKALSRKELDQISRVAIKYYWRVFYGNMEFDKKKFLSHIRTEIKDLQNLQEVVKQLF